MAQSVSGIKSILSLPWAYRCAQSLVGAGHCRRTLVQEYLRPTSGSRVLDIGCGTGEILDAMPQVEYLGFDLSPAYIEAAQLHYPGRGTFRCQAVSAATLAGEPPFDLVMAIGVLHHLDDDEVLRLFELADAALRPDGRLVTIDPVLVADQSAFARFLIRRDRGRSVRTLEGYRQLAASRFPNPETHVRHDLLNIPYTHCVICARKSS